MAVVDSCEPPKTLALRFLTVILCVVKIRSTTFKNDVVVHDELERLLSHLPSGRVFGSHEL